MICLSNFGILSRYVCVNYYEYSIKLPNFHKQQRYSFLDQQRPAFNLMADCLHTSCNKVQMKTNDQINVVKTLKYVLFVILFLLRVRGTCAGLK